MQAVVRYQAKLPDFITRCVADTGYGGGALETGQDPTGHSLKPGRPLLTAGFDQTTKRIEIVAGHYGAFRRQV
jgi:hypothetical protein